MARFASSCRGRVAPHPLQVGRASTVILPVRDRLIQRANDMVVDPRNRRSAPVSSRACFAVDGKGSRHRTVPLRWPIRQSSGASPLPERAKSRVVARYSPHFSPTGAGSARRLPSFPHIVWVKSAGLAGRRPGQIGWGARRNIDPALDVLSMVMSSCRPRVPPLFPGRPTRSYPVLLAVWQWLIEPRDRPLGDGDSPPDAGSLGRSGRSCGNARPPGIRRGPVCAAAVAPLDRAFFATLPAGRHDVSRRTLLLFLGEPMRPAVR